MILQFNLGSLPHDYVSNDINIVSMFRRYVHTYGYQKV